MYIYNLYLMTVIFQFLEIAEIFPNFQINHVIKNKIIFIYDNQYINI